MTTSSDIDVQRWTSTVLKRAGIRRTPTQIAVTQFLATVDKPVTHAEIADKLSPHGHEQSTVFRCLRRLVEKSLARQLELGDLVQRYELAGSNLAERPLHPHFLCVACGRVICLLRFRPRLPTAAQSIDASIGEVTELLIKGRCAECCDSAVTASK